MNNNSNDIMTPLAAHDDNKEEDETNEDDENEIEMKPLVTIDTPKTVELVEILTPPAPFPPHHHDNSDSSGFTNEEEQRHHHGAAAATTPTTGTATPKQTAINIFISFVGAGLLGMPYAFSQSGWLLGTLTLCAVSTANVYAMILLVQTRKKLQSSSFSSTQLLLRGYGDVGKAVLGNTGGKFVDICLVISQVGFATTYIIFISANLTSIYPTLHRAIVCYGCVPMLALLVQVTDMKTLAPFSLVADVANVLGLIVVMFQDYQYYTPHHDGGQELELVNMSSFLYVTAVSLYSLEGVGLVLPLESSCIDRNGFPKLLATCLVCITCLMCIFGVAGYVAFGDDTMAPITLNLSGNVAIFVKGALCLGLYLTYPVMMFPVNEVLEEMFLTRKENVGATTADGAMGVSLSSTGSTRERTETTSNQQKEKRSARQQLEEKHESESSPSSSSYSKQKHKLNDNKNKYNKSQKQTTHPSSSMHHHHHHHHHPKPARLFRTIVVLTSATVAYTIPDFGKFLGLVGSSICTLLGLILPCYLHTVVFGKNNLCWWEMCLNVFLIVFGVVFGVLGTYRSFVELFLKEEDNSDL